MAYTYKFTPDIKNEEKCPNCGYCKHCGRSNQRYPYQQPQPWWQYNNQPYWTTGTAKTGPLSPPQSDTR